MDELAKSFEKFLKMNNIISVFPDDTNPVIKEQIIEKSEKDGFKIFSKIYINDYPSWLISKEELSEFQKRRMSSLMEEYVKAMVKTSGAE